MPTGGSSPDAAWDVVRKTVGRGRLSVVMPVYNLAGSIFGNLRRTAELFSSRRVPVELIPVDDGSTDGTGAEIARAASVRLPFVEMRPVSCRRNSGKGAALRAGFEASTGEYVMLLDGDLDIHPARTPRFFEAMAESGADVVTGSKRHRDSVVDYPWHRRLVSFVYFTLVRIFVGLPITDTQTGMKLFRREVLGDALGRMLVKAYAFDLELLAIARRRGAKIAEAPVEINFGVKLGALSFHTVRTMAVDSLAVFYRLRILRYYDKAEVPVRPARDPLVSVVIACPGDSWMLRQCLEAISRQTYGRFETIVLPDGDIAPCGDGVRVIPTGKVRPAEKRNEGIRAAKGDVVAFIDDDAYPDERWMEYAARYFGDPSVGAVGGPGVTPPDDPWAAKMGGRVYANVLVSGGYRYRYVAGGVRRDVDDYPSCNLFVRTDVLRRIGGYRTDFWPGEDTLLCKDIVDEGLRIVYDPWVIVRHHRRPLFGPHLRQLGRYAFHRGHFVRRRSSNSMHVSYFVPSAFVAYAALAAALASMPLPHAAKAAVLSPLAVYAALVAVTSFSLNPAAWIAVAAGVVATHVRYGIDFARGFAARRAPCEFIGADHAQGGGKR